MDTKREWKQHTRLDSILNVLLIVFAFGVLGVEAVEAQIDNAPIATATEST